VESAQIHRHGPLLSRTFHLTGLAGLNFSRTIQRYGEAFSLEFPARGRNGLLTGQYGAVGSPNSGTVTGKIHSDGDALLRMVGRSWTYRPACRPRVSVSLRSERSF
jgi:hypothetical protein